MKTIMKLLTGTIVAIVLLAGCKKDVDGIKPQAATQPDNFSFKANNVNNGTGSFDYTWTNTGTKANITISTQGQASQMDIKVYDGAGVEVYSNSLDNIGGFTTNPGAAGQWRIVFVFKNFNGNIEVTARKA